MPVDSSAKRRLWNEEFSVHASEDKYVLRRQFSKFLLLTSFGMFAGNVWIWAKSLGRKPARAFAPKAIGSAAEVPVGGVKLFAYPGEQDRCILIRTAQNKFVAYSQKCTHLSCAVYYSKAKNRLECPCHEGYFSVADGSVLQGPPPRPLDRVEIEQRGGQLVAINVVPGTEGK